MKLDSRSVRANNATDPKNGLYVLCWVQLALRANDNPLIETALDYANQSGLPLLVYHELREDYPHASDRLHAFILSASNTMAQALQARNIRCVQLVERLNKRFNAVLPRLAQNAKAVFTDENFSLTEKTQTTLFARRCPVPVYLVDAARLVPTRLMLDKSISTREFRAAHTSQRPMWLEASCTVEPEHAPYDGPLPFMPDDLSTPSQRASLIASCDIDHDLPASMWHTADTEMLSKRLLQLPDVVVPRYAVQRNNPAIELGTSMLSPYLHFGMVSPITVIRHCESGRITRSAIWKFFDELLTWREWSHHRALHNPLVHLYDGLSDRTRASLEAHEVDPRPSLAPMDSLIHGTTDDPIWNASQRQWLLTGWMHNNLRMYWATQLMRFTLSARHAWALGCYLNDRLSLDGRDPATYCSMQWAFGETSATRERNIYGTAPRKYGRALILRAGVPEWIRRMNEAKMPTISVPNWDTVLAMYS